MKRKKSPVQRDLFAGLTDGAPPDPVPKKARKGKTEDGPVAVVPLSPAQEERACAAAAAPMRGAPDDCPPGPVEAELAQPSAGPERVARTALILCPECGGRGWYEDYPFGGGPPVRLVCFGCDGGRQVVLTDGPAQTPHEIEHADRISARDAAETRAATVAELEMALADPHAGTEAERLAWSDALADLRGVPEVTP